MHASHPALMPVLYAPVLFCGPKRPTKWESFFVPFRTYDDLFSPARASTSFSGSAVSWATRTSYSPFAWWWCHVWRQNEKDTSSSSSGRSMEDVCGGAIRSIPSTCLFEWRRRPHIELKKGTHVSRSTKENRHIIITKKYIFLHLQPWTTTSTMPN